MKPPRKRPAIALVVEDEGWRKHPEALTLIRRAAHAALQREPGEPRAVAILLSNDARLRTLNRQFRGKDKPTNVLSFASRDPGYLGDVAIAFGVVEREARAQRKTVASHAAHLAAHAILHLKGYGHEERAGRKRMEAEEVVILSRLGLPDPYAPRPYTKRAKALN